MQIQEKYIFLNSVFNALYNAFCFTKINQNLTMIQYFKSKELICRILNVHDTWMCCLY